MSSDPDPFFVAPDSKPAENKPPSAAAPTPTTPASTDHAAAAAAAATPSKAFSLEEANEEIAMLLESGKVTVQQVSALQGMMREHVALREKVGKLKSLLGRSAKAQREAKVELEQTQRRLAQSEREVERLSEKLEKLANRPTHMDLLADFESNFDRALLSVPTTATTTTTNTSTTQSGGQDTAATVNPRVVSADLEEPVVDTMLLQELSECRARLDHLESLNGNLQKRAAHMEQQQRTLAAEKDAAQQTVARLQLELRMAQMEAEHASRAVQDKMASLAEMQMEIDLVTKASMDANVRAKMGEEAARSVQTDRQQVQELQLQVAALQEWALASAEAKRLTMDRVRLLETKLKRYEQKEVEDGTDAPERVLLHKSSSLVIGAGDEGWKVLELGPEEVQSLQAPSERIVLRWKFDLTPSELCIDFNLLKGNCDTAIKQARADYLIRDRVVTGGAAGETEAAFAVQNACTLLWSNKKSWVRPRTVKYTLDVLAVKD